MLAYNLQIFIEVFDTYKLKKQISSENNNKIECLSFRVVQISDEFKPWIYYLTISSPQLKPHKMSL